MDGALLESPPGHRVRPRRFRRDAEVAGMASKDTDPAHRYVELLLHPGLQRLVTSGVYPNVKEWTEAAACWQAVNLHVGRRAPFALSNPAVSLVAVGDGSTPRVGAMFSTRSAWDCISVDPRLKGRFCLPRLLSCPQTIEEWVVPASMHGKPVVVVACHSHATLQVAYDKLRPVVSDVAVVAMPCCVEQTLARRTPDKTYVDWGCWSQDRQVHIWFSQTRSEAGCG